MAFASTDLAPNEIAPPEGRREYLVFCGASGVSSVGTWMQKAGVGWLVWDMTHSAAWVGAISLTDLIAILWVGPLAGAIADRSNPYRLMQSTQVMSMLVALTLAGLMATGLLTVIGLFVLAMVDSTIQGFNQPVRMSAISFLAGRERLPQAIATNSVAFNLARVIGPAIAGVLMLDGDAALVFLANGLSFLATIAAIRFLRPYLDRPVARSARTGLGSEIADGFRYVARTPEMIIIFLLTVTFSVLTRPFTELLPALAGSVFMGGPATLSLLMSAQGLGGFLGGLAMLMRRRGTVELVATTYATALGLGLTLIALCATTDIHLAAGLMVLAGICHVLCNIGMQSMAQLLSNRAYRGRVLAIYGLMFRAGPSAGAFAIGMATHWFGLQSLIGGCALIACAIILALMLNARRLIKVAEEQ